MKGEQTEKSSESISLLMKSVSPNSFLFAQIKGLGGVVQKLSVGHTNFNYGLSPTLHSVSSAIKTKVTRVYL